MNTPQTGSHLTFKRFPKILGQLVIIIAVTVIIGWVYNISTLKSILPDYVNMNPPTATLFIFCGTTLWLSNTTNRFTQIVDFISLGIIVIAAIRLLGFNPRFDTGIDQYFFHNQLNGNRMAPNTAFDFLLTGISFFLFNRRFKYNFLLSQICALLALSISLLAIIGYLYVDRSLYRLATFIPMALHTAVTFLLLTLGILFTSSQHGLMSVVMNKNVGGRISRILLPITLMLPIILGWLRIEGQRKGWYTFEFGTALLIIAIIVLFTLFIGALSWSMNRGDEKRKKAEQDMLIAKLEAEKAKKIQEQFLANMSHEIRTPINGVIGMTQLINVTQLTEEQREYVDLINESASNLLVIINDILEITKMRASKIVLEEVNYSVRDTARMLTKIFGLKAVQKGIALNCEIAAEVPAVLCGDPVRLNQILTNLINNAIKFTEKGEVTLRISTRKEDKENITLKFDVQDTGIGIPEEKLESIFESFTQASNETTRKYGGTGLGLTISKQLIELQGGEISLLSTAGKGSTFSFYLPMKRADETMLPVKATDMNAPSTLLNNRKILLAEDNLINQKVASTLLFKQGALVDIANNGREVIEMLGKKEYHIVLMDIQMPEMDGYETTEFIRKSAAAFNAIPIIALTASALSSEKSRCIECGMNDYLTKPFRAQELYEKINANIA